MMLAIFVGVLSGIIGVVCWSAFQFILNMPGVYNQLGQNWYVVRVGLPITAP